MSDGMRCGGHTGQLTGLEGCVVVVAPWSGDLAALGLAPYTSTGGHVADQRVKSLSVRR